MATAESRPAAERPGLVPLLTLLALLSGSSALAYEILYVRALTTVLGDMFYVHAALLSTFLVGIGLGAKLARWFLPWLFACELSVGLYALALPALLRWFGDRAFLSTITSSPALTILSTIAFVALPSLLIGFSIPLFSAYIKAHAGDRPAFRGVYEAYNLGAILSILAVEFALTRWLGIAGTIRLIGCVNLAIGATLLVVEKRRGSGALAEPRRFDLRTSLALACASAGSAAFQLFALKLSYVVFHPHRENFALSLAVNLLGIYLGSLLVRWRKPRFETLLLCIPLLLGTTFLAYLPILDLYHSSEEWARSSEPLLVTHKFAFLCLFALGPMVLFGSLIPALMQDEREVAGESGHLLWVSSVANAGGYLAYVLLGHPLLSSSALLCVVGGLALVGVVLRAGTQLTPQRIGAAAAGVALLVATALGWEERNFYLAQWVDELQPEHEVTVFKSGAESATLLDAGDWKLVTYNGHPSVHIEQFGRIAPPELMSGVIPALGAPRLDRVLVLGLGTGITGGAASRIFESADVVEINDAFYEMMPRIANANLDIGNNPAASLHLSDGRAFLVGREGEYDAILNSIPAPTYYSASKIYTLEFYGRIKAALKPDGVFSTWLAVPNMSEQGLRTVLSALHHHFERCDLRLLRGSYYMATCSDYPFTPRRFSELPAEPILVDALTGAFAPFDLDEVFADSRVSENLFERFEPEVERENTDDHPVLEFMVVRSFQQGAMGKELFHDEQETLNIDPVRERSARDVERMGRRVAYFQAFGIPYFNRNFRPLLARRPRIAEAYRDYIEANRDAF